jgi:hypothetical protein
MGLTRNQTHDLRGDRRCQRESPSLSHEEWVWLGIEPTTSELTGADVNFEHRSLPLRHSWQPKEVLPSVMILDFLELSVSLCLACFTIKIWQIRGQMLYNFSWHGKDGRTVEGTRVSTEGTRSVGLCVSVISEPMFSTLRDLADQRTNALLQHGKDGRTVEGTGVSTEGTRSVGLGVSVISEPMFSTLSYHGWYRGHQISWPLWILSGKILGVHIFQNTTQPLVTRIYQWCVWWWGEGSRRSLHF